MEDKLTNVDIAEICMLFQQEIEPGTVSYVFGLDGQREEEFRFWAEQNRCLRLGNRGYTLDAGQIEIRNLDQLFSVLPIFLFRYLSTMLPKSPVGLADGICRQLAAKNADGQDITLLMISVGDLFVQNGLMDHAVAIYQYSVECCKRYALSKNSLVSCVLKVSKVDFMRGSNPIETAELQREAMGLASDDTMTANDALLMLYAGVVQHFMGNEVEGFHIRERGLRYLERSGTSCSEAAPLIGWHIYLQGNFKKAIEYYEDMILSIENSRQAELSTLTYPPIIYSYMFLGEFQRAMILSEIIYNSALEHEDYSTAILTHCIEGRIHVSAGNNEVGAEILYKSLAEAVQKDFVWGQYYTLCALCQFHFNTKQMEACYDDVLQMRKLASRYHIGRMYSSPFMLDVLRELEQMGFAAIPTMNYENELRRHIEAHNIHMKGVSYRHQALLEKNRGGTQQVILDLLENSVELLKKSGNFLELGRSYVELARAMSELGSTADARRYATLAWKAFGSHTREHFPNELIDFVEVGGLSLDIGVNLYTLWLELRYVFDKKKLTLKMLTQLSRILKVESAGFAMIQNGKPVVTATQSISSRQGNSSQNQRMLGWISYAAAQKTLIHRFLPETKSRDLLVDFQREPRFVLCLPFSAGDQVRAVLYLESYYRPAALSQGEQEHLEKFIADISGHLLDTLSYQHSESAWQTVPAPESLPPAKETSTGFCTGVTDVMKVVLHRISLIAKTELPVLFTGETGVGKEVYARELYQLSGRKGPLIIINCGAIPETLMESEMFGYERGSFTGANQTRKGYFEVADGGTVFLDEIGELSLSAQVKLLRVLQEKEIMRIGGHETIKTDFRLIAATNKDLKKMVEQGRFRNDLYFRLSVLPIEIPPLRNRKADIPVIARFLMEKHCGHMGLPNCDIDTDTMSRLMEYNWPGNVRELENAIQRGILLAKDDRLVLESLDSCGAVPGEESEGVLPLEEMERQYIQKVLRRCKGRISGENGAAALLGLKRTTLISRMEKLGIKS